MVIQQFIALRTLLRVEISRFLRVWPQSLMPPVITILLYFLVFGHFIGARLSISSNLSYMQFIVPGLVMMAVVMSAYNNAAFSFFVARFQRSIEEMIISPMNTHMLLLGFSLASIVRGILTGLIVTSVAFFFYPHLPSHSFLLITATILAALLFSLLGFLNGMFAKKFDDVSIIPTFLLTPLIYLGGVFYSLNELSSTWKTVSYLNPMTYLVALFRYSFIDVHEVNIGSGVMVLVTLNVLLYVCCYRLLKKGVGIKT